MGTTREPRELSGPWTNDLAVEIEEMLEEIVDELIDMQLVDTDPQTGEEVIAPAFTEKLTLEDLLAMDPQEALAELTVMLMDPFDQAEGVELMTQYIQQRTQAGAMIADSPYRGA